MGQLPRDPRLSCRTPSSFRVAFAHGAPFWCKPMMRLFLWTLVVPLLIVPFSCGQISSGTCSPQNCSGCCSTSGQCQTLTTSEACGAQGASCVACTLGASCQSGVCINAPVGGSGVSFGGGSAGGGSLGGGTGGGTSTCRPQTCAGLGKNCGEVGDGCGGQLMCGRCEVAGESCGANGTANVCSQGTCTPRSCSSLQKNCGQVSDGCGAQLNCGTCSGTDVCKSNVCTPMTCTPLTCQQLGKNCGSISDGCNRQLNCGTCTVSSETCGGAGMVNVCGRPACTPQTCGSLNKNCGAVDDGCGTALNCGACSGTGATCGGGGTPNVCGVPCPTSCPTGFMCTPGSGVCRGGTLTSVNLDIPVPAQHTVSGVVTRNGIAPVVTSSSCVQSSDSVLRLDFTNTADSRFSASTYIGCNGRSTSSWMYSLQLYPGTYRVVATRDSLTSSSNLPAWTTTVDMGLVVSAPRTANFDIPVPAQHTVSGVVTRNGVAPAVTSPSCVQGSDSVLRLDFTNTADSRFNASTYIGCNGRSTSSWTYSLQLHPGTYRVVATRDTLTFSSNLPAWTTTVEMGLVVSAARTANFDIPVPAQHTVSGVVTRNGVAPVVTSSSCVQSSDSVLRLDFTNTTDSRFNASTYIGCNGRSTSSWMYSLQLYPGTYRVVALRDSTTFSSNLPAWTTTVDLGLVVSAPRTANFDVPVPAQHTVSGVVTRNGVAPVVTSSSCVQSSDSVLRLDFTNTADSRFNASTYIGCNGRSTSSWMYSLQLYPGTYRVVATRDTLTFSSNLPAWTTTVDMGLAVSAARTASFDIPVPAQHTVSGVVTRNGVAPVVTSSSCVQSSDYVLRLDFTNTADARFNASTYISCNGRSTSSWMYSLQLYPGIYRVVALRDSTTLSSNLPTWATVVVERLQVP